MKENVEQYREVPKELVIKKLQDEIKDLEMAVNMFEKGMFSLWSKGGNGVIRVTHFKFGSELIDNGYGEKISRLLKDL